MKLSWKQYINNPLCFNCGSFFVEKHAFCDACFQDILVPRLDLKTRWIEFEGLRIKHTYLFDWIPGESDLLSNFVYQLKSDRCTNALHFFSEILLKQILLTESLDNINALIPLPGSKTISVHSILLANAMAKQLHLPVFNVLLKNKMRLPQKRLVANERKQVEIHINQGKAYELFTTKINAKPKIIFVDDILTTGNTLKAAIKALNIEAVDQWILTLFYRPQAKGN